MYIKELKTGNIDTRGQYHLARKAMGGFIKGAGTGIGAAGAINTAFPALIPTFAERQSIQNIYKSGSPALPVKQ